MALVARMLEIPGGGQAVWATPTSGYGHLADEQPLPFILGPDGQELTPRLGGEPARVPMEAIALPRGQLAGRWPWSQRRFNLCRRAINLHWREGLRSRCLPDGRFMFAEQLQFETVDNGFEGKCPLLHFARRFSMAERALSVEDTIRFLSPLHFQHWIPVSLPLHDDWALGTSGVRSVVFDAAPQGKWRTSRAVSSSGSFTLWWNEMRDVRCDPGQAFHLRYTYHF